MAILNKPLTQIGRRQFLGVAAAAAIYGVGSSKAAADAAAASKSPGQAEAKEIAPGLFVHTGARALANAENLGDISNSVFIIGGDAVAVIDTSGSFISGMALRDAVTATTDKPIRYVINTHMHPDHVLGNAAFEQPGTTFVANAKLARALAVRADTYLQKAKDELGAGFEGTRIVMPTELLSETKTLDLGGRTLTLTPRPTAHTDNDLTIRDETTSTLILGDLLFSKHTPSLDGSIVGWLDLIKVLKAEQAARVVPGHGPSPLPWPDAIDPEQQYLQIIADGVRQAIKEGKTISDAVATVGQSEKDKWDLFSDYNARNVTAAFAELEWE